MVYIDGKKISAIIHLTLPPPNFSMVGILEQGCRCTF
jgi:hypothetical protein